MPKNNGMYDFQPMYENHPLDESKMSPAEKKKLMDMLGAYASEDGMSPSQIDPRMYEAMPNPSQSFKGTGGMINEASGGGGGGNYGGGGGGGMNDQNLSYDYQTGNLNPISSIYQKMKKEYLDAMAARKAGDRIGWRGGMGQLDGKYASEYGDIMDREQSPEETDKDIAGARDSQPYRANHSYDEIFADREKYYKELLKHKRLQNQIPFKK